MTKEVKKLLDHALNLTEAERALLAASLIESLDVNEDLEVEASWEMEINRRLSELDSGEAIAIPWTEARKKILENIG